MSTPVAPILAKDIMVTDLIRLTPDMDVYDAIDELLKNQISGAPVVDEHGMLAGIFSERDCMKVLLEGAYDGLPTTTVGVFMRQEVDVLTEDVDLLSIAQKFLTSSHKRFPVVRGRKLVGQISRRDLLLTWNKQLRGKPEAHAAYLYLSMVTDRKDVPIN